MAENISNNVPVVFVTTENRYLINMKCSVLKSNRMVCGRKAEYLITKYAIYNIPGAHAGTSLCETHFQVLIAELKDKKIDYAIYSKTRVEATIKKEELENENSTDPRNADTAQDNGTISSGSIFKSTN